ncbi:DUF354 domain-containing protein [Treponema denticola]|uniref:DUF354 domain-containing protein n=1 Tax=Treponema denticola TaxID=158 RepID=UPI0020A5A019|nr:DUF354 domain-containing protein [Treponema denticola]UTC82368.1 DUF354 domain-containing protein [Treponema denticola]
MAANGKFGNILPEEKAILCERCTKILEIAQKKYRFSQIDMADIITSEVRGKLEKLIPENIDDYYAFSYRGFQIGQIALYELVRASKILDVHNLNKETAVLYKRYILDTMIALETAHCVVSSLRPDLLLTFNPYAQCQAAKYIAEKNNIFYKSLTNISYCGSDYSRYNITKGFTGLDILRICQAWSQYASLPIHPYYVNASFKDALYRAYGSDSHIFSNAKSNNPDSLLQKLKLSKNKKTVIAFTSSNDESIGFNAAMKAWNIKNPVLELFTSTSDWMHFLHTYALRYSEIQIIVRIHPREGTRQHGKPSSHLLLLQKEFKSKISHNFKIVWSDDDISSYDLMELADLVLVTESTMGLECARLGIPILSCITGSYYSNASFMQVASNLKEYEDKLNEMINMKYTFSMLRDAIRYNYWRNFIPAIDFSETVPHDFDNIHKWPFAPKKIKQVMYDICFDKISVDDMNIKQLTASVTEHSEKYETEALLKGIELYINTVMFPKKKSLQSKVIHTGLRAFRKLIFILTFKKIQINISKLLKKNGIKLPKLIYVNNIRKLKLISSKNYAYISIPEDNYIIYNYKKKSVLRYSPLLYNLTKIYSVYSLNGKFD